MQQTSWITYFIFHSLSLSLSWSPRFPILFAHELENKSSSICHTRGSYSCFVVINMSIFSLLFCDTFWFERKFCCWDVFFLALFLLKEIRSKLLDMVCVLPSVLLSTTSWLSPGEQKQRRKIHENGRKKENTRWSSIPWYERWCQTTWVDYDKDLSRMLEAGRLILWGNPIVKMEPDLMSSVIFSMSPVHPLIFLPRIPH